MIPPLKRYSGFVKSCCGLSSSDDYFPKLVFLIGDGAAEDGILVDYYNYYDIIISYCEFAVFVNLLELFKKEGLRTYFLTLLII